MINKKMSLVNGDFQPTMGIDQKKFNQQPVLTDFCNNTTTGNFFEFDSELVLYFLIIKL